MAQCFGNTVWFSTILLSVVSTVFFFFYESKNEGIGARERGEEEEVATRSTFARFKIATWTTVSVSSSFFVEHFCFWTFFSFSYLEFCWFDFEIDGIYCSNTTRHNIELMELILWFISFGKCIEFRIISYLNFSEIKVLLFEDFMIENFCMCKIG